jgi:release factor glutamine methyltransferase
VPAGAFEKRESSWRALYEEAVERLGSPRTAQWLIEDASGISWPAVLGHNAPTVAREAFLAMLARREAGEPVQYVLGHWAFRKLDLMVNRGALIPRPETEVVVEVALRELARTETAPVQAGERPRPVVVDLGTGSGAIALSLATECRDIEVWATDISPDALSVASANLAGLGVQAAGRVRLAQGTWWSALPPRLEGSVALAVANPPYISESEFAELPEEISSWEPRQALVAGPSGLEALEVIVKEAPAWLASGASLVAEIAPHQASAARSLALSAGFGDVEVHRDLAGRDRVLLARPLA